MDSKHLLKYHAYQNVPLNFEESHELGVMALAGCKGDNLAQIQSIAILCALHNMATYNWIKSYNTERYHDGRLPQSAAEQIAGICAAIFERDIGQSEYGFLKPNVPIVMDNCGMGGDLVVTANVSTIAALIAAAGGVSMCKHGSPANADQGRHGSSDFVSMLGINTFGDAAQVIKCLEKEHFAYTEALDTRYKRIHLQTHEAAKLPHMNDIIGPITNPIDQRLMSRRVLGVNHLISPRVVAEAYQIMNERGITHLKHGLFVRGFVDSQLTQGIDEVSICPGGTQFCELINGEVREYWLSAKDFGLEVASPDSISPPSGMSKGEFSLKILRGEIGGSAKDMVIANAALLFYLAGKSDNLVECGLIAKDLLDSKAAYRKSLAVKELLPV